MNPRLLNPEQLAELNSVFGESVRCPLLTIEFRQKQILHLTHIRDVYKLYARSAIGVAVLRHNAHVDIELIVALSPKVGGRHVKRLSPQMIQSS